MRRRCDPAERTEDVAAVERTCLRSKRGTRSLELARESFGVRDGDLGLALGSHFPHHGLDVGRGDERLELVGTLPLIHNDDLAVPYSKAVSETPRSFGLLGELRDAISISGHERLELGGVA